VSPPPAGPPPLPPPSQKPLDVTVGLIGGAERRGRILRFSPNEPDIALDVSAASPAPGSSGREIIAAEKIAFVLWPPGSDDPPPRPADDTLSPFKIHVSTKRSFAVRAAPLGQTRGVGFFGYPQKGASAPFDRIYFYHHGVRRERDEPIGTMLVSAGVIGEAGVARAVEKQNDARAVPIGQILLEQRKVSEGDLERALVLQERRKLRIGEVLVDAGLAKKEDVDAALAEQKQRKGKRLGEVLVEMGIVSEEMLARTLAKKFDLPFIDLATCAVNQAAVTEIPRDIVAKYGVLPVDSDGSRLTVALSDPLALDVIDLLRFQTSKRIEEVLVAPSQLKKFVADTLARTEMPPEGGSIDLILKQLSIGEIQKDEAEDLAAADAKATSDSGIVNLVNQIIVDAYRRGASDIHLEPNGRDRPMTVRFRIDGDCVAYQDVPAAHRSAVVARVKILSKLDISERRKPQDGKIKFRIGERQIELRVATLPTAGGDEDAVLRILAGSKPMPLEQMRLSERNLRDLRAAIARPYGLVLCVGPTGSGKTTTLHSALGAINTQDMKIWTAEDPVEISQPGLRQVQVNAKIGFTFAQAMRAFLRADPDVIMVGEMRDAETAGTAVEASLTGHLVLSTLHTNTAPETVTRLLDMGLDPFSFADALVAVLAQRLARGLCTQCRERRPGTDAEYDQIDVAFDGRTDVELGLRRGDFAMWHARGCDACGKTGYKGRVALHELLVTTDDIQRAIARRAPVDEIRKLARENGMRTLLQDGVVKALAGHTDLPQVMAVCSR
jgi:type II secretory ATPase GspE/PulE/Tfp pilus assembly ATPase PilB-like protein